MVTQYEYSYVVPCISNVLNNVGDSVGLYIVVLCRRGSAYPTLAGAGAERQAFMGV